MGIAEAMFKMQEQIYNLKAENERLKEDIKFYNSQLSARVVMLQKANICLQGIKAIVCGNYEIIDPQGRKDILKLITKAEKE